MARYRRAGSGNQPAGRGLTELRNHGSISFKDRYLDLERGPTEPAAELNHRGRPSRWRMLPWGAVLAWSFALGAVALVVVVAVRTTQVDVTQADLEDGAALSEEALAALEVRIELASSDAADGAVLRFDGDEVEEPTIDEATILWEPPEDLAEGEYELSVAVPRMMMGPATVSWTFEVDHTPPEIEVPAVWEPATFDSDVELAGTVEPGAELNAGAGEVAVDEDGNFTVQLNRPPAGPVQLEAVDRAGNRTATEVIVPVEYPTARSVHITAATWADPQRRAAVLALADEGMVDAVHLQLKDSEGIVGFDTRVEEAAGLGAVTVHVNLAQVVEELHDRDVRVVGRLSAFEDARLAAHRWGSGGQDQVARGRGGEPLGRTRHTNPAHASVQGYNLDIALDAVDRGVDEIVWDNVVLPGGAEGIDLPGLSGPPVDGMAGFLARAHVELRRHGAYQGMSTLGLTIYQDQDGEDVARLARHVDFLVPEVEPQYWSSGSLDVASPGATPGEFVAAYLGRYRELADPSGTAVVPHVQAFGYGADQVRAQADAALAADAEGYVLYAPEANYGAGMLTPR